MKSRSESGQVTVFVLGIAMLVFAIAGLAVDGTRAWLYRRTLQNTADSSALAGAGELSRVAYYRSGGEVTDLDIRAARDMAAQWVAASGLDVRSDLSVDGEGVEVALEGTTATVFLGLIGVDQLPVSAEARAEPRRGRP
jgi:uncharacterized membrane protein